MTTNLHKKTLKHLALASFLNDVGSDMIAPVWPIFLTSVLGANMTILGLVDGIGTACVSLSSALSGYLSDKMQRRKIFIWFGYMFAFVSRVGYAISASWQMIIPFRILDRSGKIRSAPRDAIIADLSTRENRGKNFGILETYDNLGAVIGILLSLLLLPFLGVRKLFLLAAFPSLIAVYLIIKKIKDVKADEIHIYKGFQTKIINKNLRLLFILATIFSLGSFSYSFLLIYAKEFGFRIITIPLLYLVFTLVASMTSIYFGKLTDRVGRQPILMLSFVLWAITLLSLLFARNQIAVVISFVFYGLHLASQDTAGKAFVSELSPSHIRASVLGSYQLLTGLAFFPASFLAGLLWERIGIHAPIYFSLFLTIIAGGMLMFVAESKTGNEM